MVQDVGDLEEHRRLLADIDQPADVQVEGALRPIALHGRIVANNTPTFARFCDSSRTVPGSGRRYLVQDFSYGLKLLAPGTIGAYATGVSMALRRAAARLPPRSARCRQYATGQMSAISG
ncbi:hypothetical protein [Sphingomonas xinjiangensis]|uniref:Uncharacterized protein n=1 Tax=Sphingomonas xinjiangensis TaxID=643568 RepID=A0A840YQQ4_9SPHN|nr:hypothetical protein [Sphingomonas xinjiangensis]MBB5711222.1 hypothetical protein [Sphingomonas xinjiangensis]